ncbi:hypothetical protein [Faecalispora anaeroviscerum]
MKSLVVKAARCPQNHLYPSVKVCPVGALITLVLLFMGTRKK